MKTILVDAVYTFVSDKGEIDEKLHELLEGYENRKIILTNAPKEKFEEFGLNNVPYEVFTLEKNPTKEDPKYFEIMLENFNLKKEEVVYFEHNLMATESAKSIGIDTFHFDKDERNLEKLKQFLDEKIQ